MLDFDKLLQKNQDDDTYDTEAEDEAEKLESMIEKEKSLQTKQKEEHQKATETREKRSIVSRRERTAKFVQLASQLSHSEKKQWHEQFRGNDRAQKECTETWYVHYFVHHRGPMQEGQDTHYFRQKQSKVQRFQGGPTDAKWADWELTSEYDTDIDTEVENLTNKLQTRVDKLSALQAQQLSGTETAQIMAWVVPPVLTMTPDPPVMDMDTLPAGAEPETTMGPGQPAGGAEMPSLFAETEDERMDREQHEAEEVEQVVQFRGLFRHLMDAVDDSDFDKNAELRTITSLTALHHNLVAWQAECISVWKQLVEAAAEHNCNHLANQANVQQQYSELFAYLAEGTPEGTESVLMIWEMESGKPDQVEMIAAREVHVAPDWCSKRAVKTWIWPWSSTSLLQEAQHWSKIQSKCRSMESRFYILKRGSFKLFWTISTMARVICWISSTLSS